MLKPLSLVLLFLVTVFGACAVVEKKAKEGVDNAAGAAVSGAVAKNDPDLAASLTAEADQRRVAGEAWPWMKTIAANWELIAAALAGVGVAVVPMLRKMRRLIAERDYAGVASEVLSAAFARLKRASSDPKALTKVIAEVAEAHPQVNGRTIREMIDKAGFKPA